MITITTDAITSANRDQLRKMAQQVGLANYSKMTADTLRQTLLDMAVPPKDTSLELIADLSEMVAPAEEPILTDEPGKITKLTGPNSVHSPGTEAKEGRNLSVPADDAEEEAAKQLAAEKRWGWVDHSAEAAAAEGRNLTVPSTDAEVEAQITEAKEKKAKAPTSHEHCTHPSTKAARAQCRRERARAAEEAAKKDTEVADA